MIRQELHVSYRDGEVIPVTVLHNNIGPHRVEEFPVRLVHPLSRRQATCASRLIEDVSQRVNPTTALPDSCIHVQSHRGSPEPRQHARAARRCNDNRRRTRNY